MRTFGALFVAASLCGCSTAGPFVTSISSDGQGNLVIEKAMVELNSFVGVITTKPGASSFVTVVANDNAVAGAKLMIQQQELRAKEAEGKRAQRRKTSR